MGISLTRRRSIGRISSGVFAASLLSSLLWLSYLSVSAQHWAPGKDQQSNSLATETYEKLAAEASRAREANQMEEAITLYRKALALRPTWGEGWWYLGTLLYDRDSYSEAISAFQQAVKLQPRAGAAWSMLGLCEFQIARYDEALEHLSKGRHVGLPADNKSLSQVARYHEALALLLKGDFETAQHTFDSLSYEGLKTKDLILALGCSILQIPSLPGKVDPSAVELVTRAGQAEYISAMKKIAEAQREFQRLVADYPTTPNVSYAYGHFLLAQREDDAAVAAFKREIEVSPEHRLAQLQIANIKLRNKEPAAGIPFVEDLLKVNPDDALAHYIMGRLLLDMGEIERSIKSLELARAAYPDEPKIYYQLGRAYARAKRKDDADKALATFARLRKSAVESDTGPARSVESLQDSSEKSGTEVPPKN